MYTKIILYINWYIYYIKYWYLKYKYKKIIKCEIDKLIMSDWKLCFIDLLIHDYY